MALLSTSRQNRQRCRCYFCRRWVATQVTPKIRVDPTEGPSEYTVGRVCALCEAAGRHLSTDTDVRLGHSVEYPPDASDLDQRG